MRIKKHGWAACLGWLALVAGANVIPKPAGANFVTANNHGWTQCIVFANSAGRPCLTNDGTFTSVAVVGPRTGSAILRTLARWDTTDLSVAGAPDHNSADVAYGFKTLPAGFFGRYECQAISNAGPWRCGHAHIWFDDSQLTNFTDNMLESLACHETGHSFGLTHGADADHDGNPLANDNAALYCMVTDTPLWPHQVGTHNAAHIDYHY